MGTDHEQPYVDTLSLTDTGLHVYEAIASLEQAGQPPASEEIADGIRASQPDEAVYGPHAIRCPWRLQ